MRQPDRLDSRTLEALNARLLNSQFLSRKASGARSVVKVSEACCGINSQDFLESFSSFWARVNKFQDSDLFSELRPRGGLVRTWTVRSTMHIISTKDYYVHVFGGPGRRFRPWFDKAARKRGIPDRDFRIRSLYEPLLHSIKGRAVTSNEVKQFMVERLGRLGLPSRMKLSRGWSSQLSYGLSWSGLSEMSNLGLLVNAGRRGSQSLWMRAADWLSPGRSAPDPDRCFVELVRKYLECYGPASRADIVYWTFLTKADVDTALDALKKDLVREDYNSSVDYYSFGESSGGLSGPPGLIILPEFDSLMMGYKDKSRFLSHHKIKKVFWGLGGINRTILLDGSVAAIWRKKKELTGMMVTVEALKTLTTRERSSIREGFAAYGEYLKTAVSVEFKN
ncbi:MAG: AlkZ family DNA glycosylase [Thaumarchaeota archaeon]|nr:AlkZ family DNA glycosylase [Nitrososphaerota archaeon]